MGIGQLPPAIPGILGWPGFPFPGLYNLEKRSGTKSSYGSEASLTSE